MALGAVVAAGLFAFGALRFTNRVVLTGTALVVTHYFQCVEYSRDSVVGTRFEPGESVGINVEGAGWVLLPNLGSESATLHVVLEHWIHPHAAGQT